VKAFLDTSVLVATFYADHERHRPSIALFLRYAKNEVCCAAHSLAEVYATLTSMPPPRRVSGHEAVLFLRDIQERLTLVTLDADEYFQLTMDSAGLSLASGAIYDAVLAECALKLGARVIYTWNTKDFLRLAPAVADRVQMPPDEQEADH
jgi:predicted nucleic acid-binding protein